MRTIRSINSEFFREVASELDDQRAAIARCVGLFDELKEQLIKLQQSQDRTHALLVDEANKLGTDVNNLKSRTTALERVVPGVAPSPAE